MLSLYFLHTIKTHISDPPKALSLKQIQKRASFSFPFLLKGSMALEGSLVLPVFLFFMATILFGFEMIRFQSDVFEAMHQAGSEAWALAYEDVTLENTAGCVMTEENAANAKDKVRQYLERQELPFLCVEGGNQGFVIETSTKHLGKGNLEITASYQIKSFINWLPIGDIFVSDSCFLHGFVGYTGDDFCEEKSQEEIYVYITPSGMKYHFSENCTYLRIKIQAVKEEELSELRNASSEIYRPCEVCHPQNEGIFYFTKWGNRYHATSDCSSLRRTVYVVPISQVGTRSACSKCG